MKSLKKTVFTNLLRMASAMMIAILIITIFLQIIGTQSQAKKNAESTFIQIKQIFNKNSAEVEQTEKKYMEGCFLNAETIGYVIQHNNAIFGDVNEFRKLAYIMQVDEIHIFDDTGCIITGTHPEYFGYTFDDGEQIGFFKPMLEDKSLRKFQDIMPNTADERIVQYSAVWSSDGKYIVQVGMYPDAVHETTAKNELSYIFSLLQGNPGVSLYAMDAEDGIIVGSTSAVVNGEKFTELGFEIEHVKGQTDGVHLKIRGVDSYVMFKNVDDTTVAYVISNDSLYGNIFPYTLMVAMFLIAVVLVFVYAVQKFIDRYIIGSIHSTIDKLREIGDGNTGEKLEDQNSIEFSELSTRINDMVHILISETDKINLVLNYTNMRIGVYEYNAKMNTVRFTEHVPQMLGLNKEHFKKISNDYKTFRTAVDRLYENPINGMDKTFLLDGEDEIYIKFEEIVKDGDVLGVLIDVTQEVINLRSAKQMSNIDPLTGLYNRRGLESCFNSVFDNSDKMGHGALIVIDTDDMKQVNDTYGHAVGDKYLKRHAELIRDFDAPYTVAARTGGDEFVLLVYGYDREEDVVDALAKLRALQDSEKLTLETGEMIPLHFSFGYQLTRSRRDHSVMLAVADEYMYNSKRIRKKIAADAMEKNNDQ